MKKITLNNVKKIIEELVLIIIAGIIGLVVYLLLINDSKQNVFIEDRKMYQKEIGIMQNKLDKIDKNTQIIAEQLEIDNIIITK